MCKSCTTEWKCGLLYEMLDHHVTFYATIFFGGGGDLLGLKFMQSSDNWICNAGRWNTFEKCFKIKYLEV